MDLRIVIARVFLFSQLFVALLSRGSADEGMWPFNGIPVEELKNKYGFDATQEWLSHVMWSSVRLSAGGSGSFVSEDGLILTNHHVAADSLQKSSTKERNLYEIGFSAKSLDDEIKISDLEVDQLVSIEEVTTRVQGAVKPGMSPEQAAAARRAEIGAIEKESEEKTGLRSDVVSLYGGSKFDLYRYKRYTDIRIVFAPEFKIAFFGGDPDNFEYPRYDLDMTILRAYEDGKPAKITNYLKWSRKGLQEGELVFVSGNPGSTSRLLTVADLRFLRDFRVPLILARLKRLEKVYLEYIARGDEQSLAAKKDLFSVQNSRKVYEGRDQGLKEGSILTQKQALEDSLRSKVALDPKLRDLVTAWDEIAASITEYQRIGLERALLELRWAFNSQYFWIARTLVRLADENLKPDSERLAEYHDSARKSLEQQLFSTAPIYNEFEELKLADSLAFLQESVQGTLKLFPLTEKILAGKSPADRAKELVAGTKLKNVDERRRLATGGKAAIEASTDPMIQLARMVDADSRFVRKQYEDNVEAPQQVAYPKIAKAIFAVNGGNAYPDATFTPRLAYGVVKGYKVNDQVIAPWTTLGGAFEHELRHGARDPWKLPNRWHEKRDVIDLTVPFNFVSTADIIGGNSGSPVVNRKGELVGLIFDGNIYSLVTDYRYEDSRTRSVSVDARGMIEALRNIYNVRPLANKLIGAKLY